MNQLVLRAISEQRVLELRYHGFSRLVECHAYGRDKSGDEILRCYQISGGSESGEKAGWKLLKVREVFSAELTDEKFFLRPGYKRGDAAMGYIFREL